MKKPLLLFLLFCLLPGCLPAVAKVRLPSVLGSGMVLQRDTVVNLWGSTSAQRRVKVTPSWDNAVYTSVADTAGRWLVRIPTPAAGGPYRILIDDGEPVLIDKVFIGEVWICSGQSNMALTLHGDRGEHTCGSMRTLLDAHRYASIRLFKVGNVSCATPQEDCSGGWTASGCEQISNFSAVAYHFGRTLTDLLDLPIGLISTSWGASSIEAWIPQESLAKLEHADSIRFAERPGMMKQKIPAALFNGMIHPLLRYTARGFIWYQGEGNRADYKVYDLLTAEMVRAWRAGWGNPTMPFYCVELAPYRYDNARGIDRALLVEAQHRALRHITHSGIAGTLDLGDSTTIHPPRKREVGERLALLALTETFAERGFESKCPHLASADYAPDGTIVLSFADAPFGLRAEGALRGFEISGADQVFHPAQARIIPGRSEVKVSTPNVPHPVAVRYCFRNWCTGNLYNTSGIPAAPFRTDDWDDVY